MNWNENNLYCLLMRNWHPSSSDGRYLIAVVLNKEISPLAGEQRGEIVALDDGIDSTVNGRYFGLRHLSNYVDASPSLLSVTSAAVSFRCELTEKWKGFYRRPSLLISPSKFLQFFVLRYLRFEEMTWLWGRKIRLGSDLEVITEATTPVLLNRWN